MNSSKILFFFLFLIAGIEIVSAQKNDAAKPVLRRTTTRVERAALPMGGTVSIVGAPQGAIFVEGWRKNEVEVTAEIEWRGANEADLKTLSEVNNFLFDTDYNHIRILTTGTHDREMMKKNGRKVPKHLLNAEWKIDFTVKVPLYSDLDINGGRGAFRLLNTDGTAVIKFLESEAVLSKFGGVVLMTVGAGKISLDFEGRSYRGRGVEIQLAKGDLFAGFPLNYNADADFSILRIGAIKNNLSDLLKPRDRAVFSEKSVISRIGSGGGKLQFVVGDGNIVITPRENAESYQSKAF